MTTTAIIHYVAMINFKDLSVLKPIKDVNFKLLGSQN